MCGKSLVIKLNLGNRSGKLSKTKNRNKINKIIDMLMVILLPLLMAYALLGENFHKLIGLLMFALFILHNWFHKNWWKAAFRGKYTPHRTCLTVLNIILLILMLLEPISGIVVSRYLYKQLPFTWTAELARATHLVLAYWCYVLMNFHLGLHVEAMTNAIFKKKDVKPEIKKILTFIPLGIAVYGVYAFIKRNFIQYMFMYTMKAYFDLKEPKIYFFIDYLAIMILFTVIGHYVGKFLKKRPKRN